MKVLHLLTSNKYGGAENVACQIIRIFDGDPDYEMAYCSPEGEIRKKLQQHDVDFIPLAKFSISEIMKAVKQFSPNVIHAHDMRASLYATIAAPHVRLVSHIHNNSFDSRKVTVKALLYRIAACHANHIFWVSRSAYVGYYYHNKYERKSSVLYNVIDVEQIKRMVAEDQKDYDADIVFLGRLTYPKDPLRLISVLKDVIFALPDVKAIIVGTGEMDDEVRAAILKNNLENNITYAGFMSNPYKLLSQSKVMIMTSRWEGLPMCALEALSLGVPIVSTPTDGLKELIDNGDNGFLAYENKELVNRICELLVNREQRTCMSLNAQKKMQEMMNLGKYKDELAHVYTNMG